MSQAKRSEQNVPEVARGGGKVRAVRRLRVIQPSGQIVNRTRVQTYSSPDAWKLKSQQAAAIRQTTDQIIQAGRARGMHAQAIAATLLAARPVYVPKVRDAVALRVRTQQRAATTRASLYGYGQAALDLERRDREHAQGRYDFAEEDLGWRGRLGRDLVDTVKGFPASATQTAKASWEAAKMIDLYWNHKLGLRKGAEQGTTQDLEALIAGAEQSDPVYSIAKGLILGAKKGSLREVGHGFAEAGGRIKAHPLTAAEFLPAGRAATGLIDTAKYGSRAAARARPSMYLAKDEAAAPAAAKDALRADRREASNAVRGKRKRAARDNVDIEQGQKYSRSRVVRVVEKAIENEKARKGRDPFRAEGRQARKIAGKRGAREVKVAQSVGLAGEVDVGQRIGKPLRKYENKGKARVSSKNRRALNAAIRFSHTGEVEPGHEFADLHNIADTLDAHILDARARGVDVESLAMLKKNRALVEELAHDFRKNGEKSMIVRAHGVTRGEGGSREISNYLDDELVRTGFITREQATFRQKAPAEVTSGRAVLGRRPAEKAKDKTHARVGNLSLEDAYAKLGDPSDSPFFQQQVKEYIERRENWETEREAVKAATRAESKKNRDARRAKAREEAKQKAGIEDKAAPKSSTQTHESRETAADRAHADAMHAREEPMRRQEAADHGAALPEDEAPVKGMPDFKRLKAVEDHPEMKALQQEWRDVHNGDKKLPPEKRNSEKSRIEKAIETKRAELEKRYDAKHGGQTAGQTTGKTTTRSPEGSAPTVVRARPTDTGRAHGPKPESKMGREARQEREAEHKARVDAAHAEALSVGAIQSRYKIGYSAAKEIHDDAKARPQARAQAPSEPPKASGGSTAGSQPRRVRARTAKKAPSEAQRRFKAEDSAFRLKAREARERAAGEVATTVRATTGRVSKAELDLRDHYAGVGQKRQKGQGSPVERLERELKREEDSAQPREIHLRAIKYELDRARRAVTQGKKDAPREVERKGPQDRAEGVKDAADVMREKHRVGPKERAASPRSRRMHDAFDRWSRRLHSTLAALEMHGDRRFDDAAVRHQQEVVDGLGQIIRELDSGVVVRSRVGHLAHQVMGHISANARAELARKAEDDLADGPARSLTLEQGDLSVNPGSVGKLYEDLALMAKHRPKQRAALDSVKGDKRSKRQFLQEFDREAIAESRRSTPLDDGSSMVVRTDKQGRARLGAKLDGEARVVIVTGDRGTHTPAPLRKKLLEQMFDELGPGDGRIFVHGAAKGVDSEAGKMAAARGWKVEAHPAKWDDVAGKPAHLVRERADGSKYNAAAGPERNTAMRRAHPADGRTLVVAVHGDLLRSKGTRDMVAGSVADGYPVEVFSRPGAALPTNLKRPGRGESPRYSNSAGDDERLFQGQSEEGTRSERDVADRLRDSAGRMESWRDLPNGTEEQGLAHARLAEAKRANDPLPWTGEHGDRYKPQPSQAVVEARKRAKELEDLIEPKKGTGGRILQTSKRELTPAAQAKLDRRNKLREEKAKARARHAEIVSHFMEKFGIDRDAAELAYRRLMDMVDAVIYEEAGEFKLGAFARRPWARTDQAERAWDGHVDGEDYENLITHLGDLTKVKVLRIPEADVNLEATGTLHFRRPDDPAVDPKRRPAKWSKVTSKSGVRGGGSFRFREPGDREGIAREKSSGRNFTGRSATHSDMGGVRISESLMAQARDRGQMILSNAMTQFAYHGKHVRAGEVDLAELERKTGYKWAMVQAKDRVQDKNLLSESAGEPDEIFGDPGMNDQVYVIPEAIRDVWKHQVERPGMSSQLLRYVTRHWVGMTLPFSIAWHTGNFADQTMRLMALGPGAVVRGGAMWNALEKRLSAADVPHQLREEVLTMVQAHWGAQAAGKAPYLADILEGKRILGTLGHHLSSIGGRKGYFQWEPRDLTRVLTSPRDSLFAAGSKLEELPVSRIAGAQARELYREMHGDVADVETMARHLVQHWKEDPGALDELHRRILQNAGDWTQAHWERKYLTNAAFPFWTWMRNALHWTLWTVPMHHPNALLAAWVMSNMTREQRAQLGVEYWHTPKELYRMGMPKPLPIGTVIADGEPRYLGGLFSVTETGNFLDNPRKWVADKIVPWAQGPLAAGMTGQHMFDDVINQPNRGVWDAQGARNDVKLIQHALEAQGGGPVTVYAGRTPYEYKVLRYEGGKPVIYEIHGQRREYKKQDYASGVLGHDWHRTLITAATEFMPFGRQLRDQNLFPGTAGHWRITRRGVIDSLVDPVAKLGDPRDDKGGGKHSGGGYSLADEIRWSDYSSPFQVRARQHIEDRESAIHNAKLAARKGKAHYLRELGKVKSRRATYLREAQARLVDYSDPEVRRKYNVREDGTWNFPGVPTVAEARAPIPRKSKTAEQARQEARRYRVRSRRAHEHLKLTKSESQAVKSYSESIKRTETRISKAQKRSQQIAESTARFGAGDNWFLNRFHYRPEGTKAYEPNVRQLKRKVRSLKRRRRKVTVRAIRQLSSK